MITFRRECSKKTELVACASNRDNCQQLSFYYSQESNNKTHDQNKKNENHF